MPWSADSTVSTCQQSLNQVSKMPEFPQHNTPTVHNAGKVNAKDNANRRRTLFISSLFFQSVVFQKAF